MDIPIQRNSTQTTNPPEGKDYSRYLLLNWAALKGDWTSVKKLVEEHPDSRTAQIDEFGTTLLHLAVRKDESMWLVEDILNSIELPSQLEVVDMDGKTALSYAVIEGNIKAATKLLEKNEGLLLIRDTDGYTPLHHAARVEQKESVKFLLSKTKDMATLLTGPSGATLFFHIIRAKMYVFLIYTTSVASRIEEKGYYKALILVSCPSTGIALDILKQYMKLDENHLIKTEVLRTLAQKPQEFASGNQYYLNLWQQLIYQWIPVTNNNSTLPQSKEKDYPLLSIVGEDVIDNESPKLTNSGFSQRLSNGFGKVCPSFWNIMKRVPQINHIHDKKLRHMQALELVKLICKETIHFTFGQAESILKKPLFIATSLGIVEFVNEITEAFPHYPRFVNDELQNIFHFTILYRQEHVFKIINKMDHSKYYMTNFVDKNHNNILHLAGKLQPLSRISGAALPMQGESEFAAKKVQLELQWFKAVEDIIVQHRPSLLEDPNLDDLTPREVFTKDHKLLLNEGHKWFKDLAQSYIVVTTLIITMMFAVAFTVPGGSNGKGVPIYLHDSSFTTFIVSDAIALIFSCFSVLMYLGILTSRFSEEDFLMSLPTKMILGFITLYISLGWMTIAFYATLNIDFHHPKKQVFVSVFTLVGLAMLSITSLQLPLLFEILGNTYGPKYLQPNKMIRLSFANFRK